MNRYEGIIVLILGFIFMLNIYLIKYILKKNRYFIDEYLRIFMNIKSFIHLI